MNKDRDFNKDNMKGCCPKVPQQPNFSDCGLFALQYVESFFKSPIKDFSLPITSLRKWFPPQVMRTKRADIGKIIRDLAAEQNPKQKISFPVLCFTPESGSGYTDDEDEDSIPAATKLIKPGGLRLVKTTSTPTTRVICLTSAKSIRYDFT